MSRVPAFTLMESLLSLLLMGVVGAMAMLVVQYLHRDGGGTELRRGEEEVLWLLAAINADGRSSIRSWTMEGERPMFIRAADTVHYEIIDSVVVRRTTSGDKHEFHISACRFVAERAWPDTIIRGWTIERNNPQWTSVRSSRQVSVAEVINSMSDHADIPATPR